MMHTSQALYGELKNNLLGIDEQMKAILSDANLEVPEDIYKRKNADGTYVLTSLILARSQTLSAMAALKAAETNAKTPRR